MLHKVDDVAPEVWRDAPSPKVMRRRMYVGGVSSKLRRRAQHAAAAGGDGDNNVDNDDEGSNENYVLPAGFTVIGKNVVCVFKDYSIIISEYGNSKIVSGGFL